MSPGKYRSKRAGVKAPEAGAETVTSRRTFGELPAPSTVDSYIPLPRRTLQSADLSRPAIIKSKLAELGVETKIYGKDGRPAGMKASALFALCVTLKYGVRCTDPIVRALFEMKQQIWLDGVSTLYAYCFERLGQLRHADRKLIREGFELLQEDQVVAYEADGVITPVVAPWLRVIEKPEITAELREILNPNGEDEKRIRSGMIIAPDAALDFILKNGFIRLWGDFLDRLADAREATGFHITPGRIMLAVRIADETGQAIDGLFNNAIRQRGGFFELHHTLRWFGDALGLGANRRAGQRKRMEVIITDDLEFVKAGGFIEQYAYKEKPSPGYVLYLKKPLGGRLKLKRRKRKPA